MLTAFVSGIAIGLTLALLIGPAFFALMQLSLTQGARQAVWMCLGIAASDALYIALVSLGLSQISESPLFRMGLGYGGGLMLVGFGIASWLKKVHIHTVEGASPPRKKPLALLGRGFLLNSLNPFTFFFWMGTVGGLTARLPQTNLGIYLAFLLGVIGTVLGTDVAKVMAARQLRPWITSQRMTWLNRITGLALVVFGIRLLVLTWLG